MSSLSLSLFTLFLSTLIITHTYAAIQKQCPPELRDPNEPCPQNSNLVCAYFTGDGCDSDLCQKLSPNACVACKDPSVEYYTDGLCEREKVYCDSVGREDLPERCDEYGEVCGYYQDTCPAGICAQQMNSSCAACRDPKVIYYQRGQCNALDWVKPCKWIYFCNETDFPYFKPYKPVCGWRTGCESEDCTETVQNECLWCDDKQDAAWFKDGVCGKDRIECTEDSRSQDCSNTGSNPVCASFVGFRPNGLDAIYTATADNACSACVNPAVTYYIPGECPASFDNKTYCLPGNAPENCPDVYEPVCGWKRGIGYDYAYRNLPNACQACQDPEVTYYEPGTCSFKCRPEDLANTVRCNGSLVEPVCARYTIEEYGDRPVNRSISVKNKCVACFDLPTAIDSYSEGLCEGDEGILCENEPWSYYYGSISPVCGLNDENCNDDSCRVTYAEPVLACQISSEALYMPGVCPGDQGIDCIVYRNGKVCEQRDFDNPVCGYITRDCQSDGCRQTYRNQCYACDDSQTYVVFFTEGACE